MSFKVFLDTLKVVSGSVLVKEFHERRKNSRIARNEENRNLSLALRNVVGFTNASVYYLQYGIVSGLTLSQRRNVNDDWDRANQQYNVFSLTGLIYTMIKKYEMK